MIQRCGALIVTLTVVAVPTFVQAQGLPPDPSAPTPGLPPDPSAPLPPQDPTTAPPTPTPIPPPPGDQPAKAPKQPQRGDFDAGGKLRLPSGPDEEGAYAAFNWAAVDLHGKYWLLDSVTIGATAPIAIVHPDTVGALEPGYLGGITATLDARTPKFHVPMAPKGKDTEIGVMLSGSYMKAGAMLLSDKDFPLYVGDFEPGFGAGFHAKLALATLVDFSLAPQFVYQHGDAESLQGVQVPTSLILKLGSLVKLSADLGIYTGDGYTLRGSKGGRIPLGAALDVKLGPIIVHAGAGAASLTWGGVYPTIRDSIYLDLNVKFAK